jgi:hypothetical protein
LRYKGIKEKAWQAVRRSVKRRESDCYTCPAKDLQGVNAQAGHYFPVGHMGSNNALSWHPKLIHLQCSRCNGPGQGMQNEYRHHLIQDYGVEFVEEVEAQRYKVNPVKDWEEVIKTFDEI